MYSKDQIIYMKKLTKLTDGLKQFVSDVSSSSDEEIVLLRNVYHLDDEITVCIDTAKKFDKNKKIVQLIDDIKKIYISEKNTIEKAKIIQVSVKDKEKIVVGPSAPKFACKNGKFFSNSGKSNPSVYNDKQDLNQKLSDCISTLTELQDKVKNYLSSSDKTIQETMKIERYVRFMLNTAKAYLEKYRDSKSIINKMTVLRNISTLHDSLFKLYNDNIDVLCVTDEDPFAAQC
jgi:hypothetical protein